MVEEKEADPEFLPTQPAYHHHHPRPGMNSKLLGFSPLTPTLPIGRRFSHWLSISCLWFAFFPRNLGFTLGPRYGKPKGNGIKNLNSTSWSLNSNGPYPPRKSH